MDPFQRGHPFLSKNSGEMLKIRPESLRVARLEPTRSTFESRYSVGQNVFNSTTSCRTESCCPLNRSQTEFESTLKLETPIVRPRTFTAAVEKVEIQKGLRLEPSIVVLKDISPSTAIQFEQPMCRSVQKPADSSENYKDFPPVGELGVSFENRLGMEVTSDALEEKEPSISELYKHFIREACSTPDNERVKTNNDFCSTEPEETLDQIWSDLSVKPTDDIREDRRRVVHAREHKIVNIADISENRTPHYVHQPEQDEEEDIIESPILEHHSYTNYFSQEPAENFESMYTLTENEQKHNENNHSFETGQESMLPDPMSWSQMLSQHLEQQQPSAPETATLNNSESGHDCPGEFDSLIGDFEIVDDDEFDENEQVPETM